MLTTEANKMIGKRARVINSLLNTFYKTVTIDQVLLHGSGPMRVRVIPDGGSPVWLYENDLEVCTCEQGGACYLCSEKCATPPESTTRNKDAAFTTGVCAKCGGTLPTCCSCPPQTETQTPIPVYHHRDNIFFTRYGDGTVHLAAFREPPKDIQAFFFGYPLDRPTVESHVRPYFEIQITPDEWVSIVASVSVVGDTALGHDTANVLHMGGINE